MSSERPVLSSCAGRVCSITLNRPAAMNAITVSLATELERALLAGAAEADVIAIRGAGGNFCVGGDFKELERLRAEGPEALRDLFESFASACATIARLEVPVLSVVEGNAMAGGFELMLASDLVLAAEDATIADNHSNYGQVPGGGSSQRLPRLVGAQRAAALILSGDRLSGSQAANWGIAYRAVPAAELDAVATELTERLAGKSRAAQATIKRLMRDGAAGSLEDGLHLELEAVVGHVTGKDAGDGIATFAERSAR